MKSLMFKTGELTRDIGTTVIGVDAVSKGLINQVGGIADAIRELNRRIEEKRTAGVGEGGPMIYSIVPTEELFFDGWENDDSSAATDVTIGGITMQVVSGNDGQAQIVRLISGNPYDYMNPGFYARKQDSLRSEI